MGQENKNNPENIDPNMQPLSELTPFLDDLDPRHGNPQRIAELAEAADIRIAKSHLRAVGLAADAAIEAQFAEYPETLAVLRGLFEERDSLSEQSLMAADTERAELAEKIEDINQRIKKISQGDDSV